MVPSRQGLYNTPNAFCKPYNTEQSDGELQ